MTAEQSHKEMVGGTTGLLSVLLFVVVTVWSRWSPRPPLQQYFLFHDHFSRAATSQSAPV